MSAVDSNHVAGTYKPFNVSDVVIPYLADTKNQPRREAFSGKKYQYQMLPSNDQILNMMTIKRAEQVVRMAHDITRVRMDGLIRLVQNPIFVTRDSSPRDLIRSKSLIANRKTLDKQNVLCLHSAR